MSNETVKHPNHYNTGKIEVIDFVQDQKLNFCLGNVVKYVCRAGKKDPDKHLEDLRKALTYLEFEIADVENSKSLPVSKNVPSSDFRGIVRVLNQEAAGIPVESVKIIDFKHGIFLGSVDNNEGEAIVVYLSADSFKLGHVEAL